MAKQTCDPYRSGYVRQGVAFAKPGVDIAKGDLICQDATNPHYVVPASEYTLAAINAAAAAFVGVAQNGRGGSDPERRIVFAYTGDYMYPLDTPAHLNAGATLTFDDDGVDLKAQGFKPTATAAEVIAKVTVTTGHPDIMHNPTVIATANLGTKDEVQAAIKPALMA